VAARLGVCAAAAFLLFAGPAAAGWRWDATLATRGLDRAVAAHRLAAMDADRYRNQVARAEATLAVGSRADLASALHDAASLSGAYDGARALTLFSTLRVNARYAAAPSRDVTDEDGIVYRRVSGRGYRFHALASFGALNTLAGEGRYRRSVRLAYALLARARPYRGGLVWESYFPWSGGGAPWRSGLTQAVATQALARAGFRVEARLAFRGLTAGLLGTTAGGPWVRLYSFDRSAVLNAQLQAALSLREYARRTGDGRAAELARRLRRSAATLMPAFDTGFWTRYSLRGEEEPLSYHRYVVSLLWKLSATTHERRWARWAARFRADWRKPPSLRAPKRPEIVYPVPADGFRDRARIRFWVSKPARVTVRVGGSVRTRYLQPGHRRIWWSARGRGPGTYPVRIVAVDRVGNRTALSLPRVVVRRDTSAPKVRAWIEHGRLRWRAHDAGTPWLRLRVVLYRGGERRTLALGRRPFAGRVRLPRRASGWGAVVVAADTSGNFRLLSVGQ
jgi:hypothetical protein